jgi:hypothetical protein
MIGRVTLGPMTVVAVSLLAHQGGWDELLFVLLPMTLFAGLLLIANRRATRAQDERDAHPDDDA